MKKILTLLVVLSAMAVSAQSVQVKHFGENLNPGDTVFINFEESDLGEMMIVGFGINNVSGADVRLKVYKDAIDVNPEHAIEFCLSSCYSGSESDIFTMTAGEEYSERDGMHVNFTPEVYGTSLLRFRIQNVDNVEDEFPFYVSFSSATGIRQMASENGLRAYPNPATTGVTVEYNSNRAANSYVVIKNITGSEVYKQEAASSGKMYVSTSNLKPGIYFYGLEDVDGKMICAKKLLVK